MTIYTLGMGATMLLNVAYLALVSSTMTRTIIWLRVALTGAAVLFVVYGLLTDNFSMVFWNSITGTLHSVQLVRHIRARMDVTIDDEDEAIHQTHFAELDDFDFYCLWSLGETVLFDDGEITVQGTRQDDLLILLEGVVEVRRDGEVITHLGPGDFLGEMSFVTGDLATAGSRAIGRVRARSWEHARVEALDELNPTAGRVFHRRIQQDLAQKLGSKGASALAPHEHSDEELAREERQRWWGRF